jgi:glutathione synthase/RimK-type ligase-like ATP-grasp enzyme
VIRADDFRTCGSDDPHDYTQDIGQAMIDHAVRAAQALRVEFAGVDILEHPTGRLYFLEANFPAYFANAQKIGGHDIAGAIVDHLLNKAIQLEAMMVRT